MYFLPSYGRPQAMQILRDAPGGMPDNLIVVLNEDDPRRAEYEKTCPWPIEFCPAGSRFADAWAYILRVHPDLPWYGMLGDDHIAQTPGWNVELVNAASTDYLAYPNGEHTEFPLMRGVCVIGGELVRQMGFIVFPALKHNYCDVILDLIARDIGHLRPLEHLRVDHCHWKFVNGVIRDETYVRGSVDQSEDAQRYHVWLGSLERNELHKKLVRWRDNRFSAAS